MKTICRGEIDLRNALCTQTSPIPTISVGVPPVSSVAKLAMARELQV